jgi:hypothetical protein
MRSLGSLWGNRLVSSLIGLFLVHGLKVLKNKGKIRRLMLYFAVLQTVIKSNLVVQCRQVHKDGHNKKLSIKFFIIYSFPVHM